MDFETIIAAQGLFHEIVPELDHDLLVFCGEISPNETPVYTDLEYVVGTIQGECFQNVQIQCEKHGGTPMLGWTIWRSAALFHAESHCNWVKPDGHVVDITPKADGESTTCFLPDKRLQFNGRSIPSERKARKPHAALQRFIDGHRQLDELMATRTSSSQEVSVPPSLMHDIVQAQLEYYKSTRPIQYDWKQPLRGKRRK